MFLFILLLSSSYPGCESFNPNRFLSQSLSGSKYEYKVQYFETLVDHYTFAVNSKFKLRYLISEKYHVLQGPILFYTGNEGDIELFAENTGFIWEIAEELKAAVVFAEHRFYGESLPFSNESFKDYTRFGYFTAEQALADFASLIHYLRASNESYKNSAVVAFGGSYGGMLSAWLRQKYPNLVTGAIASSAPVWMFPGLSDCHGFYRVATHAFNTSGNVQCVNNIAAVWKSIREVINYDSGGEMLTRIFVLCKQLTDAKPLIDYLVDFFGSLAMVNYPYEASFLGEYPANPVQCLCKELSEYNPQDLPLTYVRRVAWAVRNLINYTSTQKCIDLDAASPGLSVSGWELQTCLEMATPMCSNGVDDMFPPTEWNAKVFSDDCLKKYGISPRLDWAEIEFWGKDVKTASNIVYSNGDLDPWSAFGVLNQKDVPSSHVIRIPSGAHHLDLRARNSLDPKDVISARQQMLTLIKQWISQ